MLLRDNQEVEQCVGPDIAECQEFLECKQTIMWQIQTISNAYFILVQKLGVNFLVDNLTEDARHFRTAIPPKNNNSENGKRNCGDHKKKFFIERSHLKKKMKLNETLDTIKVDKKIKSSLI